MMNREEQNGVSGCFQQEVHIDGEVAPMCKFPKILSELHDDNLINVFSYLSYTDLMQARLVCRRWMDCIAYKHFSKKMCLRIRKNNVMDIYKQLKTAGSFASGTIYNNMICIGTDQSHSKELQFILQKLGIHVISLKLIRRISYKSLYRYFPNIEHLNLDEFSTFAANMKFNLNAFQNLRGIQFVDGSMTISSSQALLTTCLRKNTQIKLEELSVHVYSGHAELFLRVLKDHAHTLKSLHVDYFDLNNEDNPIVEEWLKTFAQLKKLQKVKLSVSNTAILEYIMLCLEGLSLRYLEVDGLRSLNPNTLKVLQSSSKTIEHLALLNSYLPRCTTDKPTISENCVNLKRLILVYTSGLDEYELCNIASKLLNLEILVLHSCGVTNKSLAAIFQHLTQLRELDLSGNDNFDASALEGTPQQPYSIQRLGRLEKLNLKSCRQLSAKCYLSTLKFSFLRCLSLGRSNYTHEGLELLGRQCPMLEKLTITHCPTLGHHGILSPVNSSMPRLRVLHTPKNSYVRRLHYGYPYWDTLNISKKRANEGKSSIFSLPR